MGSGCSCTSVNEYLFCSESPSSYGQGQSRCSGGPGWQRGHTWPGLFHWPHGGAHPSMRLCAGEQWVNTPRASGKRRPLALCCWSGSQHHGIPSPGSSLTGSLCTVFPWLLPCHHGGHERAVGGGELVQDPAGTCCVPRAAWGRQRPRCLGSSSRCSGTAGCSCLWSCPDPPLSNTTSASPALPSPSCPSPAHSSAVLWDPTHRAGSAGAPRLGGEVPAPWLWGTEQLCLSGAYGLSTGSQGSGDTGWLVLLVPRCWCQCCSLAGLSGVPGWHMAPCAVQAPGCVSRAITEMAPVSSSCWKPVQKLSQHVRSMSHWGAG